MQRVGRRREQRCQRGPGAGERTVVCSFATRAKGCSKPCTKRALVPIRIPSPHRRALLLPVTPVWMHCPPPPSSHGALTALRLQDRGARWHGTGHGTCRRKQDGAGRPACTRMEGHRDFSILNRETGDCSPPKNAFPGQRQLIAELLRAEQRGETSAGVPGHSAFPLQMTRHFLIHEKD